MRDDVGSAEISRDGAEKKVGGLEETLNLKEGAAGTLAHRRDHITYEAEGHGHTSVASTKRSTEGVMLVEKDNDGLDVRSYSHFSFRNLKVTKG